METQYMNQLLDYAKQFTILKQNKKSVVFQKEIDGVLCECKFVIGSCMTSIGRTSMVKYSDVTLTLWINGERYGTRKMIYNNLPRTIEISFSEYIK